jgi:5-methylcytosine-specific restriction endonuclease McrA
MQVLERNGFTCQLCGHGAGDADPYNPSRKVRLHIDHIVPQQQGGGSTLDNLRVVCSVCNQARGNIQTPSESARNLIARIRRAPRAVQREVFVLLKKTFTE